MSDLDYDRRTGELVPAGQSMPNQATAAMAAAVPFGVDLALANARQFPRDEIAVIRKITALATIDEEAAEECLYALVRGKKRDKRGGNAKADDENKPIEGPSIRLAEIAAQKYGNCRYGADVVEINRTEMYVKAEGYFHDLETNTASRATIRRNIRTSGGKLFSEDMITVTGNAACAISKRNAILAGIPRSIYRPAYQAARKLIAGDASTLGTRWETAVKSFAHYGVKPEQLLEHLGIESSADITGDNLVTLRGMFGSLHRSEATVEEMFSAAKQEVDKDYDPLGEAAGTKKDQKPKLSDDELDKLFADGQAAGKAGAGRAAPEGLEGEAAQVWLNGHDDATKPEAE